MYKSYLQPYALTLSCCVFLWVTHSNIAHGEAMPATVPSAADIAKMAPPNPPNLKTYKTPQATAEAPPKKSGDIFLEGAEQITIPFSGLAFNGMAAYPTDQFFPLYASLVGHKVTLQQVINIINQVNDIYRKDGFIFSYFYLPEQDITGGFITVNVVEGHIENILIDDTVRYPTALTNYVDGIRSIYPFNIHLFEQAVLKMNNMAGAQFQTVLRPPKYASPGGIDIAIIENTENMPASISVNNYGSPYAGPWQMSANTSWDSVIAPYDKVDINLSAAYPLKEVKFTSVNYKTPVPNFMGLSFKTGVSWGSTESGSNLEEFELGGLSREVYLSMQYAHLLTRRTNWMSEIKFRAKNTRSKILGSELYDDRARVVDLSTTWQHIDNWDGATLVNFAISRGLNVFGAQKTGSENLSRADGHSDHTKMTIEATHLHNLPYALQGIFQFSGQFSFDPLLSGEEFSFGGVPRGRGLDPSEITGDHGFSASAELRYNGIPHNGKFSFLPYAFLDFGKVWQKGISVANAQSATTTGAGIRIGYDASISLDAMIAIPLTMGTNNSEGYRNAESPRLLINVTRTF